MTEDNRSRRSLSPTMASRRTASPFRPRSWRVRAAELDAERERRRAVAEEAQAAAEAARKPAGLWQRFRAWMGSRR